MILVDTGPLVALCDARDARHALAVRQLRTLAAGDLAVCDAVIVEACFHLPHPSQRRRLGALLQDLRIRPVPSPDERAFRLDVFEWLAKYEEHEPDWADGCLAVMSERNKTAKVWTFDGEFRTIWRRPNGTAIPLATRV